MSKEYLLESLEKKINDIETYYRHSKEETKKRAIKETSDLLNKLKIYSLDEKEKKKISKAVKFVCWLKEHLR